MARENPLGSGIKLSQDWDIEIDNTGDIATTSGGDELSKDIAMLISIRLQQKIGTKISNNSGPNSRKEVELLIKRLLQSDDRVRRVPKVEASNNTEEQDSITVQAEVIANDNRDYELVFEVDD